MSHEIQTAVFSGREGAGWTGLGQAIPAEIAKDPRAIAELCNATYTVSKRECFFKNTDGSLTQASGREVLVRDDTNTMLSVVSDNRYHIDNRQPVNIFEAFLDELAQNKLEISHAAVLSGGAQIAVCATLPPSFDFNVGNKKDTIKRYVTMATGYDGKHGTRCSDGNIRVVCANTLAYAMDDAHKRGALKTIRASTILETTTLAELLKNIGERGEKLKAKYDALANRAMSSDEVSRFFADVLEINITDLGKKTAGGKLVSTKSENMLRELAAAYNSAPGAGLAVGTAWGALNAVTYYATHVKTVRDTSGSGTDAARVASNLNGDAARLKLRALALAASMVAA